MGPSVHWLPLRPASALPALRAADAKRQPIDAAALLRALCVAFVVLPVLAYLGEGPPRSRDHLPDAVRQSAALLWALCLLPAWVELGRARAQRRPLPILPLTGLLYGSYYALPALLGVHNRYGDDVGVGLLRWLDPAKAYDTPMQLALLGWLALSGGYALATRVIQPPPMRRIAFLEHRLGDRGMQRWALVFIAVGIAFSALWHGFAVPIVVRGLIHFADMFAPLGTLVLCALGARGRLTRRTRALGATLFVAYVLVQLGSGATYNAIVPSFAAASGLWIGGGRLRLRWAAVGGAVVLSFIFIRGVMHEYRLLMWQGFAPTPSQVERTGTMVMLLHQSLFVRGAGAALSDGVADIASRSANLDLFADVVRRTPSDIPYWDGSSYASLVGIAIPRVLWPDKPVKRLGNVFGHRYGYLAPGDGFTSINLPVLVEWYANFGVAGVAPGMLLIGLVLGALTALVNRPGQGVLASGIGLTLLHPLLVIECDLSLQYGGVVLNGLALLVAFRAIEWLYRPRQDAPAVLGPMLRILAAERRARIVSALPGSGAPSADRGA